MPRDEATLLDIAKAGSLVLEFMQRSSVFPVSFVLNTPTFRGHSLPECVTISFIPMT